MPGHDLIFNRSNPGKIRNTFGGVGRNIAEVAGRLGTNPYFITSLGDDEAAQLTTSYLKDVGVEPFPIVTANEVTGKYVHVMKKNGDLALGVADMHVNRFLTFDNIYDSFFRFHRLLPGTLVEVDSNVPAAELSKLIPFLNEQKAIILYEGISGMCTRILESGCIDQISLLKINHIELGIFTPKLKETLKASPPDNDYEFYMKQLFGMVGKRNNYANTVAPFRHLIVTHGEEGSDLHREENGKHSFKTYPVLKCNVVKTNGAGDTMTGTLLSALARQKYSLDESMKIAICGTKFAV
jgi:sugar/nucleoside kinase (ribokinase family)